MQASTVSDKRASVGLFDDNRYITVTPGPTPSGVDVPRAGEVAHGSFWTLVDGPEGPVIDYVSGEIAGRRRRLSLSAADAQRLQRSPDDATATAILIEHGRG